MTNALADFIRKVKKSCIKLTPGGVFLPMSHVLQYFELYLMKVKMLPRHFEREREIKEVKRVRERTKI